ncbi:hypothetical protein NIES2111_56940 (plasmid) [Nostoc sp. NIES-2111]|nr:hypothetical protein NIES2111_56940 [Nostoc sp. NIES-2111]
MNCVISALEKNWYLSPPWGQQIPSVEVSLSEKVYFNTNQTFGYCCGVQWQQDEWVYAVNCNRSIVYATKHQIIGTGRLQSTYLKKPAFVLGDRIMLRFDTHATKQRLILGIVLVNNAWFYVLEMKSPSLKLIMSTAIRFPLVSEKDLVRIHL